MTYARFRMQVLSIVKILDTASALVIISNIVSLIFS